MTSPIRSAAAVLATAGILVSSAAAALAQGLSVYAPIAPKYTLGDFTYNAPDQDGWRQVASNPGMFILVYAESLPPDQVLTRLTVIAETHEIPEDAREAVEDGQWLARQSYGQQTAEREGKLIAYSPIQAVGDNDVYKYTLVTPGPDDKDSFESFYVKMAPDKSSYFIAKFTTSESKFQEQAYLSQFEESLNSLRVETLATEASDDEGAAKRDSESEVADENESAD